VGGLAPLVVRLQVMQTDHDVVEAEEVVVVGHQRSEKHSSNNCLLKLSSRFLYFHA
jgi:hypothetical protein